MKAILDVVAPGAGRFMPSLEWTRRRTSSLAREAAFLAYSEADVEHDFLRIVELLNRAPVAPNRLRWWQRLWRPQPMDRRRHLVVVLDELDKLTATADGMEALEALLNGLKNLLATAGAHFIFVGGADLHDRAVIDSQRGNSVYSSVFGWQIYIPCVWDGSRELLDVLPTEVVNAADRGLPSE